MTKLTINKNQISFIEKLPILAAFFRLNTVKLFCTFFTMLFFTNAFSQSFELTKNCQIAYDKIMQLNVLEAQQLLDLEKLENPENVAPYLFENYLDFFEIFINENETYFEKNEQNKAFRLAKIETLPNNNAWKKFAKAEILTQWSLARLKFEQYFKSVFEARKAFKLIQENQAQFPDFAPNKKTLGFYHSLVGTVPNQYKFAVNLFGFSGNVKNGLDELTEFNSYASKNNVFEQESKMLLLFLEQYFYQNNTKTWYKAQQQLNDKNSLLENFLLANFAYRNNNAAKAIEILNNKPIGENYLNFYYMDYILGLNKLYAMDSTANVPLKYFIENATNIHYKKDAWQKLAWYNLLIKKDTLNYNICLNNCLANGKLFLDADKQAQKEAENKIIPNVYLLKARLQSDGGFFEEAIKTLKTHKNKLAKSEMLEYHYRLGKIAFKQNEVKNAIVELTSVLKFNNIQNDYFAPKSCILLGMIYEKLNNKTKAIEFYDNVFLYDNYNYQNSIEQQAKAALNRLKS